MSGKGKPRPGPMWEHERKMDGWMDTRGRETENRKRNTRTVWTRNQGSTNRVVSSSDHEARTRHRERDKHEPRSRRKRPIIYRKGTWRLQGTSVTLPRSAHACAFGVWVRSKSFRQRRAPATISFGGSY